MSKGREPKARVEPVFYGEVYKDAIGRTDTMNAEVYRRAGLAETPTRAMTVQAGS